MKRIRLDFLKREAEIKADGYVEDCLTAGTLDGTYLEIDEDRFAEIRRRYRGLGDWIAAIAQPVAVFFDRLIGTKLSKCQGCTRRHKKLNSLTSGR